MLIGRFWFTQACWQVDRQLQLHCLCRLNLSIPCMCLCIHLPPSLIIFTADNLTPVVLAMLFSQVHACICKSLTWARQYTGIHGASYGVHGSQESGWDKFSIVIHRYNYSTHGGCWNVGFAQAHPNKAYWQSISTIQSGLATPAVVETQANKHANMFCGLQLLNVIIGFSYTIWASSASDISTLYGSTTNNY